MCGATSPSSCLESRSLDCWNKLVAKTAGASTRESGTFGATPSAVRCWDWDAVPVLIVVAGAEALEEVPPPFVSLASPALVRLSMIVPGLVSRAHTIVLLLEFVLALAPARATLAARPVSSSTIWRLAAAAAAAQEEEGEELKSSRSP